MNGQRLLAATFTLLLAALSPGCATTSAPSISLRPADLTGIVRDNLDQPVAGAGITVAGVSAQTAADGSFRLPARGRAPYVVSIEHPDFAYYARVLPHGADVGTSRLTRASRAIADPTRRIVLRDERRPEDCVAIAALPESKLPCGPGFAVSIPANSLVDSAGNPPTGPVEVKLATFEIHTESMPAPFAIAASDLDPTEVAVMTPYGAGAVEVRDVATGRPLNLAPGRHARIEIPLHRLAALRAGADSPPATIPLLRYNRSILRWVRIGTMPLVDGRYSAEVDHLSEFNADAQSPTWGCIYIEISGSLPSQLVTPQHLPITLRLAKLSGNPTLPHTEVSVSTYVTAQKGPFLASWPHVIYNLAPGDWYSIKAMNGATVLTYTTSAYWHWAFVSAQVPQVPALPFSPSATCNRVYLVWDASLGKPIPGTWRDYDVLAGYATFNRVAPIIRSLRDRTVIRQVRPGERVAVGGIGRDRRWLLVITREGEYGLAPVVGADLSGTERPVTVPRPAQPEAAGK